MKQKLSVMKSLKSLCHLSYGTVVNNVKSAHDDKSISGSTTKVTETADLATNEFMNK